MLGISTFPLIRLVMVLTKHICSHGEHVICQPLLVLEYKGLKVDRPHRQHSVSLHLGSFITI